MREEIEATPCLGFHCCTLRNGLCIGSWPFITQIRKETRKQPQSTHTNSWAPCNLGPKTWPTTLVQEPKKLFLKTKSFVVDVTNRFLNWSGNKFNFACLENGQLFNVERAEVRHLARGLETVGPHIFRPH